MFLRSFVTFFYCRPSVLWSDYPVGPGIARHDSIERGIAYIAPRLQISQRTHFCRLVRERTKERRLNGIESGSNLEHDQSTTNPAREDCRVRLPTSVALKVSDESDANSSRAVAYLEMSTMCHIASHHITILLTSRRETCRAVFEFGLHRYRSYDGGVCRC